MVKVSHDVNGTHADIQHLGANRMTKGVRPEPINLTVWTQQRYFLSECQEFEKS
jgi:hypothetical protein